MLSRIQKLILVFIVLFSLSTSLACDFLIRKTVNPFQGQTAHNNLCLEDYFESRDLAFYKISSEAMYFVMMPSVSTLQYDDMVLFDLPNSEKISLGKEGRLALVQTILSSYFSSLKNNFGKCTLQIYDGEKLLSLNDFKIVDRDLEGQPGSRMILTKDDVIHPSWKMLCPTKDGSLELTKSGHYFFVFADVHENISIKTTSTHYAQFLFSFH